MWEDSNYCWVVLCKNHWFHIRRNLFSSHRIPLGETDAVMPLPPLDVRFPVRCDECGKEYRYKPSEVRRYEQEIPDSFVPHPLFRLEEDRRRSQRSLQSARLIVRGESGGGVAFQEKTFATSVSSHGALIVLSKRVALGQKLFLQNPRTREEIEVRVVRFGPPYKAFAQLGVEFVQPASEFWRVEAQIATKSSKQ